jgi:hypothetical protein
MRQQLGWAVVLQTDVNHKSQRLAEHASGKVPAESLLDQLNEQANSQRIERQQTVVQLVTEVLSAAGNGIADESLRQRVATEELSAIDFAAFSKADSASQAEKTELLEALRSAWKNLDDLADERVRAKEELATEVVEAQKAIEQVDLKKSPKELAREIAAAREKALHEFNFEVLAKRVKASSLDEHVQQYLLKSLSQSPDPKYQQLISAYFNSLLPQDKKTDEASPDEKSPDGTSPEEQKP